MTMFRGDTVRVRVGGRPARKATVVTQTGALTYLVKYGNGDSETVSAGNMELIKGGRVRRNETGVAW